MPAWTFTTTLIARVENWDWRQLIVVTMTWAATSLAVLLVPMHHVCMSQAPKVLQVRNADYAAELLEPLIPSRIEEILYLYLTFIPSYFNILLIIFSAGKPVQLIAFRWHGYFGYVHDPFCRGIHVFIHKIPPCRCTFSFWCIVPYLVW